MATLLDAPKPSRSVKDEEFVGKQLVAARRRVRVLDYFLAGLVLAVGSLGLLLVAFLINRYVETPRGTGWAALGAYVALAIAFLYLTVLRPSRRQINPYFAARRVEETVPNAKNSLVTWVDFEEDARLPGSIRTAIGQKAARDLKGVDLNRAIENRRIIWLAIAAGVFLLANVVVAFLKPTRTELTLEEPKNGDITVFNNQDVNFQVHVAGRIPGPNETDAVRLRLWYSADDPDAYEDRPMRPADDDRRQFQLTVPAKQVRNGFQYKILAGKTDTAAYTVTCKIIPEFTGFEVHYEYPAYLKSAAAATNDPNLLAPYGTQAKLIATVNREVKHGHVEIEGQVQTIDGRPLDGRPDAIEFTVPIEKEGFFRIWITTPEGDKNQDPARLRLGVIDPKPLFRMFDLAYTYPDYLRFKQMNVADVREPEIEGLRGTKVVLTAKTTREVKDAKVEIEGLPAIVGEKVPDQPTWVRFQLPAIEKDSIARLTFTPATSEGPSAPRSIPIRAIYDLAPTVQIDTPKEEKVEIAANATLELKGLATDDHGVDKLTLKMELIGAEKRALVAKSYRGGLSFKRKEDNSWPTRVEYKDFVKLQDLRMEKDPNWRVAPGMEIDVWLEAKDNCEPRANEGKSDPPKRIRVTAPAVKPEEKRPIDEKNQRLENEQKQHEKKQDNANANDKRDVNQEPPKGADNPQKDGTPPGKGPDATNPMKDPSQTNQGTGDPMGTPPEGSPDHAKDTDQVNKALTEAENANKPGAEKPSGTPPQDAKVEPGAAREPKEGPMGAPPLAEDRTPKNDPNKDPMGANAGESRGGNVDKTKEEKGSSKDGGETKPGMTPEKSEEKPSFGGTGGGDSGPKPEPKDPPKTANDPAKPEKGTARKDPSKSQRPKDPMDAGTGDEATPGATKPEQDVKPGDTKKPSGEPGKPGETAPKDASASKPKESPKPGDARPQPKKDEVADTGDARTQGKPMDGVDPGETPMPKPGGTGDEQARGDNKPGPGSPPSDKGPQPRELNQEIGELSREINSTNPEVSDKAKEDVDRLMRNPQTREQTREELDKLEKNAKDPLSRKKAQDLRKSGEQAAKNYDNEKPNEEKVDQLAKKLDSKDERERKEAEQRANDWKNNPETKKDFKNQVDQLKKKDRDAGERVENAMNKPGPKDAGNQTPKVDDKQLADMAKDLNGNDENAKQDAKDKLEKMMRDPKSAKEAQEKLNQMADKATGQDKKDLENAAKQAGNMAKDLAKDNPPTPKLDPKDLEKAARQLASGDPKDKQAAKEKIEEMMKDAKAREQAQEMLKEMAKNAKTPEDRAALENAAKQAEQIAKEMGDKNKMDPKDLKDLAEKFKNMDAKAKEDLQKEFEQAMKDPKKREEIKKTAEEMAKNATPEQQKQFDEMMRQLAGNNPEFVSNPDPADPRNKLKAAELILEKFKRNITNEEFKERLKWTDEQEAQWIKDQEAAIAALRKQAEKGDWRTNRDVRPANAGGPTTIKLDPKAGNDPLQSGRFAPPSGYADPYKKFAGGATEPKK